MIGVPGETKNAPEVTRPSRAPSRVRSTPLTAYGVTVIYKHRRYRYSALNLYMVYLCPPMSMANFFKLCCQYLRPLGTKAMEGSRAVLIMMYTLQGLFLRNA